MNTQMIYFYIEKINNRLFENGYSHSIGYWRNGNRMQIFWKDENNYHSREFGNMTFEKAERFLEGLYFGLQIGLLDKPIE